jgi:hypothetical protein
MGVYELYVEGRSHLAAGEYLAAIPPLEQARRVGEVPRHLHEGVDRLTIKRHGAWKSDAVDKYITVSAEDEIAMVQAILTDADAESDGEQQD